MVTQEKLKEHLSYDAETGLFCRIKSYQNQRLGKVVGGLDADGYRTIGLQHKHWRAHRLAWLYVYGKFPDSELDHINGNRDDNRICNLREVSPAGNSQNQRKSHDDSTYGLLGVDYNKTKNRFRARIQIGGVRITLGGFSNPQDAHEAYLKAKRDFHSTCTI
jgi:hypothetical protein